MADERQCTAMTRAGTQCKHRALPDSDYCHIHQTLQEEVAATNGAVASGTVHDGDTAAERRELVDALDALIADLEEKTPAYTPPPFSPRGLIDLARRNLDALPPAMRVDVLYRLREAVRRDDMETWRGVWFLIHYWNHYQSSLVERLRTLSLDVPLEQLQRLGGLLNKDLFDPEAWKGLWFMVSYSLKYQADFVRRRLRGEYDTDPWGLDWELLEFVRPFFTFLYKYYWRVEASGLEHIPDYERALIVANHSGQLPFDGAMIGAAVMLEHPSQRLVRNLYADWFPTLPFLAPLLEKMGQTLASVDNGSALLSQEELVAVYPEGYKGGGKLYKERYRLARFGRGGFVKMALNSEAPMIPTAVVGAEETYISLYKSPTLSRLTGFPYFPISPTWPWLGLLGLVPLPSKWYIDFGSPIPVEQYGPDAAENLVLVSQLTDQVRNIIQEMLYERLAQRRSVIFG
ncbi:MAG: lysophospholipid acyltransferase family protein [Anaerolineae bacterium]|nr:lysophospholipid acyltransferase family protein [Anaerolineae bacterium]